MLALQTRWRREPEGLCPEQSCSICLPFVLSVAVPWFPSCRASTAHHHVCARRAFVTTPDACPKMET